MIQVVIENYDDGNATPSSPEYYKVSGTVNGMMSVVNSTMVNATQGPSGIVISGSQMVSDLSPDLISHTFTVPQLSLNLPIPVQRTTVIAILHDGRTRELRLVLHDALRGRRQRDSRGDG